MGCRILEEKDGRQAVLYCSTSGWAFGPVFYQTDEMDAGEVAEAFLKWLRKTPNEEKTILGLSKDDPRSYEEGALQRLYSEFLAREVGE